MIIQTNRLYLREFVPEDGAHFFAMNADPEVIKYTGDRAFNTREEADRFIRSYTSYQTSGYGRWAVCDTHTDAFLGWCGLKYDPQFQAPDLGFRFYRNCWGKGYATEASIGCIAYGFEHLGFERIIGKAYQENKASIKVLEKCNFEYIRSIVYDSRKAVLYELQYADYQRNKLNSNT